MAFNETLGWPSQLQIWLTLLGAHTDSYTPTLSFVSLQFIQVSLQITTVSLNTWSLPSGAYPLCLIPVETFISYIWNLSF